MHTKKKKASKLIAMLLAVIMAFSALPFSVFAVVASDVPEAMQDNAILRALEYTGYNVQKQKDNGTLYQNGHYGSRLASNAPDILSDISYGLSCSGKETVASGSTVTGLAPNIAKFEQSGLCCAAFVTYFICNYLPNIEGADTQFITDAVGSTGMNSQAVVTWQTALNKLADQGKIEKVGTSSSNVDYSKLVPGDIIIFGNDSNSHVHTGIYAGTYKGTHFIIHVGNERGPEISTVEGMGHSSNGDKASYPNAFYHLPDDIFQKDGLIEVRKTDENGKALAGAVFIATNTKTGKSYRIGPTNSSGYAASEAKIPFGAYRIVETVFPANYQAHGKSEWTVTLDKATPNAAISIHAVNTLIPGSAKIVKTSEDGKVDGVSFRIQGNGIDKTVQTKNGGQIQIENLKPGVYTVTEQGYDKYEPQETRSVTVVSGQTATVTFNNKLKRGDLTVTKTAEDGLVQGMRFHLHGTSLSGLAVDEYAVVGSDGKAYFQGVLIGNGYALEEAGTPDRYIVPEKQTADIEWNKVTGKNFENILKRGDLTVTKTAEDGLTKGIRFHLYGTSYSGIAVDEYATVGSDGKAYFKDVLIGTGYTLEEADTAIRYVIPANQTAAIEWNKATHKSFDNVLKKWNLTVTKRDSETGAAQGDASLAGAVYGIYKGDQLVDTYTTDRNGQFTTKAYICDSDWTLREISASEGYLVTSGSEHIGAEAKLYTVEYNSTALDVLETVQKGKIALIKHCDDGETQIETPEAGAEFEVFLKASGSYEAAKESERDILVCDEFGFAETKDLPYGIYTVCQTKGWDGKELMDTFDVFVSRDGETYRYLINNATFEALIEIVKKDIETGKTIPASGIGFKVRNTDTGEYIVQHINYPTPMDIDTYYTDSTGKLMMPEALPYGNYEIIEQNTCYGYVLDSTPIPFTVDGSKKVVTVEKHNIAQKGTITVSKTGEVFSSVTAVGGGYVDENGNDIAFPNLYQPVYSVQGLAGAVYEITAAEDIYTLDGTFRYAKGDVVAEITTDENGTATSEPLYLGKFEVREIKAPYGMTVSDEVHPVELTYAGQEAEITETATAFYNERQKAEISLSKILEKNETFGIGRNFEILSVQFGLFAAEELTSADGSAIPADGLLEIINCDENGNAVFKTDIPVGAKLYVKEIAADNHYLLSDEKYPVEFAYAGQETAHVEIKVNDGNAIENDLIYGNIKGLKIDRETEETIAGALFGLFKADETEFTAEKAILTAKSGEDGIFIFENVPYGNWIIKELAPAEGFLPNEETYPVTVSEHGEIIEITVANDRIPEIGTIASIEGEKQAHPAEMLLIEDQVNYQHLIPGKEYVLKGILMDKATGLPFLANSAEVRSEFAFVPETPSGTVIITFLLDASTIKENTDIVVFERLYKANVGLAAHADIEAEEQAVTVHVPEIGTQATVGGEKKIFATEVFILTDTVSYKRLITGKEYVLKGVLMDKATGKPLVIDGQEIHSETVFIPEAPTGEAIVEFTFDSKYIKTDTDIVVFESLYKDGKELAVHADIEDEGQAVRVKVPEIGTQATAEGKKEVTASGRVVIEDIVSYKNLNPGKDYTVKGVLMDKSTGEPLLIGGEEIRSSFTFKPETPNGEIAVTFVFDASGLTTATEIVVFENLYRDGVEIAAHTDIEDDGQTVKIVPPVPENPKTGDDSNLGFWIGLAAISLGGLISAAIIGIKQKKDDDQ